jgi:hypothetical protein
VYEHTVGAAAVRWLFLSYSEGTHLAGVQYQEGVWRQRSVQLSHQAVEPLQGGVQRRLQLQV